MPTILILTGPGGAGKTTIAKLIAGRCGYVYIDGDREDTEFFPDGHQWFPENREQLRKAHEKIFQKVKGLFDQGKSVVIDYIIFGRYQEFLDMFRREFGGNVQIKVLFPSLNEMIRRDKDREIWTTGTERITVVMKEFQSMKDSIGAQHFIDTTGQAPEETFLQYFSTCQ